MEAEYYLHAGSVVEGIHLLHVCDFELLFAVLLSALLNSTSLPSDLNFITIFTCSEIYITKASLCLSAL